MPPSAKLNPSHPRALLPWMLAVGIALAAGIVALALSPAQLLQTSVLTGGGISISTDRDAYTVTAGQPVQVNFSVSGLAASPTALQLSSYKLILTGLDPAMFSPITANDIGTGSGNPVKNPTSDGATIFTSFTPPSSTNGPLLTLTLHPLATLSAGASSTLSIAATISDGAFNVVTLSPGSVSFSVPSSGATYSISGGVETPGATITAGSATGTSDAQSNYTVSGLAAGTYTLTPSKAGCVFSPVSRSVTITNASVTGQNFTANCGGAAPTVTLTSCQTPIQLGQGSSCVVAVTNGSAADAVGIFPAGGEANRAFSPAGSGNVTITIPAGALQVVQTYSVVAKYIQSGTNTALATSTASPIVVNAASPTCNATATISPTSMTVAAGANGFFTVNTTGATGWNISLSAGSITPASNPSGNATNVSTTYTAPASAGSYTLTLHAVKATCPDVTVVVPITVTSTTPTCSGTVLCNNGDRSCSGAQPQLCDRSATNPCGTWLTNGPACSGATPVCSPTTFTCVATAATVDAPTFSPPAGTYTSGQTVTISGPAGADVYYTTNGTAPYHSDVSSSPTYTGPIDVSTTTDIRAIAVLAGTSSSETDGTYTIAAAAVCTPGQTRCSGAQIQHCNASGQWDAAASCQTGYSCSNAVCAVDSTSTPGSACPAGAEGAALDAWLAANGKTRADIAYGCDAQNQLTTLAAPPDVPFGTMFPLAQFTHLTTVNFQSNGMVGTLPASLASYPLTQFWVAGSKLTGSIPQLPPTLTSLHLGGNQLTGTIPPLPTGIREFHLFINQLSGPIPPLSGLTALTTFNIEGNQLTGSIPALPTSGRLTHVQLGRNQLTGGLPLLPAGLQEFLGQSNLLDGTLVPANGSFPSTLKFLWVPENQLTGTIPPLTGTALEIVHVGSNRLTGSIPALPASIKEFHAFANQLTGPIPSLASYTALTKYNVGINQLSGTPPLLPPSMQDITLTQNQLVGPIPQPFPAGLNVYAVFGNRICPPYPYPTDGRAGTFALEPQDTTACNVPSAPAQTLTAQPPTLTANGQATSTLTAQLYNYPPLSGRQDTSGYTISFSRTGGSGTLVTTSAVTDVSGRATVQVRAPTAQGAGTFQSAEVTRATAATTTLTYTPTIASGQLSVQLTVPLEARTSAPGNEHGTSKTSTLQALVYGPGVVPVLIKQGLATDDAGRASFTIGVTVPDGTKLSVAMKDSQHIQRCVVGTVQNSALVINLSDPSTYEERPSYPLKGKRFLPAGDIEGTGGALHDGSVTTLDLTAWVAAFKKSDATAMIADLDGNGIVGAEDLSLIIRNYNSQGDPSY